jgi:hypothetical protein
MSGIISQDQEHSEEHRRLFLEWYTEFSKDQNNDMVIDERKKKDIISVLSDPNTNHNLRYKWKKRYGFVQLGDMKHLYFTKDAPTFVDGGVINLEKLIRVVTKDELFDRL